MHTSIWCQHRGWARHSEDNLSLHGLAVNLSAAAHPTSQHSVLVHEVDAAARAWDTEPRGSQGAIARQARRRWKIANVDWCAITSETTKTGLTCISRAGRTAAVEWGDAATKRTRSNLAAHAKKADSRHSPLPQCAHWEGGAIIVPRNVTGIKHSCKSWILGSALVAAYVRALCAIHKAWLVWERAALGIERLILLGHLNLFGSFRCILSL